MSTHAHVGKLSLSLSCEPAARAAAAAPFLAAPEFVDVDVDVTVAVWVTAGAVTTAGGLGCVTVVVVVCGADGVVTVLVSVTVVGSGVVVGVVAATTVGVATHPARTTVAMSAAANTQRRDPRSVALVAIPLPFDSVGRPCGHAAGPGAWYPRTEEVERWREGICPICRAVTADMGAVVKLIRA